MVEEYMQQNMQEVSERVIYPYRYLNLSNLKASLPLACLALVMKLLEVEQPYGYERRDNERRYYNN
jgi:hypothetical protein